MQIKISIRHGNLSEQSQEIIKGKLEKLNRVFERLTAINLTVDLEKADHPKIDLHVSAEHRHDFVAGYSSEDLFGSVDQVVHKIEQQLRKYKERIQDHHKPVTPNLNEEPPVAK